MQSLQTIADIELEKNVISRLMHLCFRVRANVESKLAIAELNEIFSIVDCDSYVSSFSITLYADICSYLKTNVESSIYPSNWDLRKYFQQLPKYQSQQHTITKQLSELVAGVESEMYSLDLTPLSDLAKQLVLSSNIRKLRIKLDQGKLSSEEIITVRDILNSLEESYSSREILSQKLMTFRTATDPITRIEVKKSIRQLGYSPQEVLEVTDNYTPPRPAPKITPALEFLNKKFSDATWVYPGIIKAGVVNLITGQGGSGKTMFCYDAMMAYLDNAEFIGEPPSVLARNKENRGLIINADQPGVDAQEMLKSNPRAWRLAREDRFSIVETDWCLGDILYLEMLLKEGVYNFLVVDSYKAIHSHLYGWDENHPSASMGIKELQRLCSVYGVTMLLVHHAGTTESKARHKSRGHSSIPDTASSVLSLSASVMDRDKPAGDPNIRFLEISKTRNAERTTLTLRFDPLKYSYDLLPDPKGQERGRVNKLADVLMMEFNHLYPTALNTEQLLKKVQSQTDRRTLLAKALQKLEQRGMIEKEVNEDNEFLYRASKSEVPAKKRLTLVHSDLKDPYPTPKKSNHIIDDCDF